MGSALDDKGSGYMTMSVCKRDGFPLAEIDGRLQCVAEFLNRCLGLQQIVDAAQRQKALYYIFENGHELPLLCYCCNRPLACNDVSVEREKISGLYLKSMVWDTAIVEGREVIDFRLELASPTKKDTILQVPTSILSASKLIHPATCLYKGNAPLTADYPARRRHRRR